jgi:branched-chain amino acid transport system permease protein
MGLSGSVAFLLSYVPYVGVQGGEIVTDFLVFAVLGLGAGVAYLALAFGVVVVYKGSGVLNFAHGGIAMVAAFVYADLSGTQAGQAGLSRYVALLIVLVGGSVFGLLLYFLVMKHLRRAPVLAKVVATLGLLAALQGFTTLHWGAVYSGDVLSLFPTHGVSIGGGASVGVDRFYGAGVAAVVTVALAWLYTRTRFGLATRGAAESEKGASLLGYSPDVIASLNWALGCALAALAGVIIAPIAGLDSGKLPLMILPALAAALLGRFRSFTIAAGVALGIGIAQSELTRYWSDQPGVNVAVPLAVVIVAMIVSGRLIPQRGALSEGRPPKTPSGRIPVVPACLALAATVALLIFASPTYQAATATSIGFAILALSLVVITGFTGQISIAQMTFAGLAGLFLSKLELELGVPFPLSVLLASLLAVPVGVLVGLPALRVRGINLAVVTFALAFAVTAVVFENPKWTGSDVFGAAAPISPPSIAGWSLDGFVHPDRVGLLGLAILLVTVALVSNLRRSSTGRKMLAVRSNERAAAAAGIGLSRAKLQAFAISSFIAGLGGCVLSYANNQVNFPQFSASASIALITIAYIGGIASISGAMIAGGAVAGGVSYVLMSGIPGYEDYFLPVSGVLLIVTVLAQPDGIAPLAQEQWRAMRARWRRTVASDAPAGVS